MTQDDIIRMAREAGLNTVYAVIAEHEDGTQTVVDHRPFLERFAALVAAAERAACADICDQHASIEGIAQRCAAEIRARNK
jgi:hypothetical protein